MKNRFLTIVVVLCTLFYVVESCQKDASTPSSTQSLTSAISSLQAIGVGSTTASASAMDSIYVIRACSSFSKKDSIGFSSLPSAVTEYLNSNYAGHTPQRAFAITDSSGAATGYVVIIVYNNSPVGLKFDASGNFVTVLEQKLGRELEGCINNDSTYTHHEHPYDSAYIHDDHDSTHAFDSTHLDGDMFDSTNHDHDSAHHHHH